MGEKRLETDWYFFASTEEYALGGDPYKHSLRSGLSNYLFLDLHVAAKRPDEVRWGFDVVP